MPWGAACRSTCPIVPSLATTLKPVRSCPSTYPLSGAYDQILSVVTLLLSSRVMREARLSAASGPTAPNTLLPHTHSATGTLTGDFPASGPRTSFTFLPVHFQAGTGKVVLDAFVTPARADEGRSRQTAWSRREG